jgi:hypothetical protein
LNPAASEAAQFLVLIATTGFTEFDQQFDDGILGNAGHAASGANRIPFA